MTGARPVIVWGNCQAEPLADLLRAPLARHGHDVLRTPAVYLIDAPTLAEVHSALTRAWVLITQPVSDYHLAGMRDGDHQPATAARRTDRHARRGA